MNPYAIFPLIVAILFLISGSFVYFKNKKSLLNILLALEWLTAVLWLFGYFMVYSTEYENIAIFWTKVVYTGVIFIPTIFYHFTTVFLKIDRQKIRIFFYYLLTFIFLGFVYFSPYMVSGVRKFSWGYQTEVSFLHSFYLIYFAILYIACLTKLYFAYKKVKNILPMEYIRIKYVFSAFVIAAVGFMDFIPNYGIEVYPFGFIFVGVGLMTLNYAIIKHRLMEIEVIVKRTVIFAGLFMFVSMSFVAATFLAQEFLAGILGANTKWAIFVFGITIITLGMRPLEKWLIGLTDRFLFQKKYDYQQTLKEASEGMTLVTDMKKLLNFIVRVVTKKVRIKSAVIFQYEDEKNRYILRIRRGTHRKHTGYCLDKDNVLVSWLIEHKEALLIDEIEDWLKSERFLRKEKHIKDKLITIKEELVGMDGVICVPSFSKGQLIGFLALGEKLSGDIYTQEDVRLLSTLASSAAIAVENAKNFMELEKLREHDRESYIQTVLALAKTVDEKDDYTRGHLEEVAYYGMQIAKELEDSSEFKAVINMEDLKTSLRLHDIGKIGIPDAILHKNGKLKASEWKMMKQHCEIGAGIVEPLEKLKNVGNIIKHHQERYDGSGYPEGLKGEDIPIESRIIAVVDAYHAMISDRPYRKALSEEVALAELRRNIGTQFDPIVVSAFFRAYEKGKIKRA